MNIEGKMKALALVISSEKTRPMLSRVNVIYRDEKSVDLVATNGEILLLLKCVEWIDLVAYYKMTHSYELPSAPIDGLALFVTNKERMNSNARWSVSKEDAEGLEASLFPYPKFENVIPSDFSNDVNTRPLFSDRITNLASKIISLVSIGRSAKGTYYERYEFRIPHGWNGKLGGAVKFINEIVDGVKVQHLLLVMPIRDEVESIEPFSIPNVLTSDYFIDIPEVD